MTTMRDQLAALHAAIGKVLLIAGDGPQDSPLHAAIGELRALVPADDAHNQRAFAWDVQS